MNNLSDNEIIKALECCGKPVNEECCSECPYHLGGEEHCHKLIGDTIDLINRQKSEIEDLKEAKEKAAATAMRVIKRQDAEIKRLLTKLTRFNEKIAQPYILINTDAELTAEMKEALRTQKSVFVPDNEGTVIRIDEASIKAEAVKEFAERLKDKITMSPHSFISIDKWYIDNLVKEMAGENNG